MHRLHLVNELHEYAQSQFILPEELLFIERFLNFIKDHTDCFSRTCTGHITGSAFIVDHTKTKTLLTHHRKLNMWIQLGGHADGETAIKKVALKEAQEESGIDSVHFLVPTVFDIDIHPIPGPCAYHYDVRYLLQAPENAKIKISDESHDLAWIPLDEIKQYTQERSVVRLAEKAQNILLS